MKLSEQSNMKGHLTMTEIYKPTGERNVVFDEDNVITIEGFSEVMKRITYTTSNGDISGSYIHNIVLGDDVGSGTLFEPEDANNLLTAGSQSTVYTIPNEDINFNYLNSQTLEMGVVLNGTEILNANFPQEVDMRYTSATVRFYNGKCYSYKRFPVRSLSRLVDIEIIWRISLTESTN